MTARTAVGTIACILLVAHAVYANAPLVSRLGLDTDQAKGVARIQAKHQS